MWQKFSMFFFLHCSCDQKYTARSNYCFILQLYGRYCKQKHNNTVISSTVTTVTCQWQPVDCCAGRVSQTAP